MSVPSDLAVGLATMHHTMSDRPNLLLIMTDQQRWDYVGYAGGPCDTPNLDRLAARGVRFEHGYTPSPICVPARVALATGQHPSRVAPHANATCLPREHPTYYQRLRDHGYRVGCVGKLDLAKPLGGPGLDGQPPRAFSWGFTHPLETEGKWAGAQREPVGPYTQAVAEQARFDAFHKDYRNRGGKPFPESAYPSVLPDDLFADTWIGQRAVDWLDRIADDLPWHLFVSFVGPHDPFDPPAGFLEPYLDRPMPPAIDSDLVGKPDYLGRWGRYHPADADAVAHARRHYCGAITAIDEQVGLILDALERRRELDRTFIVFVSDHGENLGDHGAWEKQLPYDCSIRVPLCIAGPGLEPRDTAAMAELHDLNPTLCDFAGLPPQHGIDARSLVPLLRGETREHRESIYTMMPGFHCIRTRDAKLVENVNDRPELYDMRADPHERVNRHDDDPAQARRLRRMLNKRRLACASLG